MMFSLVDLTFINKSCGCRAIDVQELAEENAGESYFL